MRWDTSVGKATSYWPDSSLVDVYITYTGSFLAQCSEVHKVCSLVGEHVTSQWRIERTGVASVKCTQPTLTYWRKKVACSIYDSTNS
jgi:hypothetical protein